MINKHYFHNIIESIANNFRKIPVKANEDDSEYTLYESRRGLVKSFKILNYKVQTSPIPIIIPIEASGKMLKLDAPLMTFIWGQLYTYCTPLKDRVFPIPDPPMQKPDKDSQACNDIFWLLNFSVNYLPQFYKTTFPNTPEKNDNDDPIVPAGKTNVFCKNMPLKIPFDHFKVFTVTNSKNGKPFLTNDQFNSFIDRAFCGNDKLPKLKFNKCPRERSLIQWKFYDFYKDNSYHFNTDQCQPIFIRLLTDNFEGWDFKKVQENFKPKSKKRL